MVDEKSRKKNDLNHRKKRQCRNCGTTTHKKAGLLGKKSIPITIEGKVYQGRCLACKPFQAASTHEASASAAAAITILSPTVIDTSQTPQGEPPDIRRTTTNNSNNDDNNSKSKSNSNSNNQIASLLSSSSSSSSSSSQQQRQQPQRLTTAVNMATTTTTATTITSQPRQRQEQQQQRQRQQEQHLETISGIPPRQQRTQKTQSHHHRLDTSGNNGNFDDNNNNNRDVRMRSQQQRQKHQKPQQRVIHNDINNDIDIEARVSLPSSPSAAANVGIPRILEVVHRDRLICNGNISDNNIDSDVFSDDHSVVSTITMDIQLLQAYDDDYIPPQRRRPGPERNNLADGDFYDNNNNNSSKNRDNTGDTDHQINPHHRRRRHHKSSSSDNIHRHRSAPPISEARDTSTPVDRMSSSAAVEEDVVVTRQEHNNKTDVRIRNVLIPPDSTAANDVDDNFPSFIIDDYKYNHDRNCAQQQQQFQSQQHNSRTIVNTSVSALQHITIPEALGISSSLAVMDKDEMKKEEVNNVSEIFRCLNIDECNPDIRVQALTSVGNILRNYSGDKRDFILEHNVTETVTKSMWADMEIVEVQDAAINLLFVIAASTVSHSGSDDNKDNRCNTMSNMLSNNESVCDSILFTMQNHSSVSAIQLKGCLIFASLAATSSDNRKNSDGSLSGAMNMVLNAMSNHVGSRPIRKAGLQALHHQCLLSVHAEDNKKRLIESKLENGMSGINVIIHAMEELQQDFVAMEWACELSWCMTTSKDLLKHLEDTSLHEHIVSVCRHYMTNPVAVFLIEACIGTIANLSYLEEKRNQLINIGAFEMIINGLRHHEDNLGISYEATLALQNFALSPRDQDSVGKSEAVPIVVLGLQKFMNSTKYTGEALRALACMATSQLAKERIGTQGVINIVHQTSRKHDDNADVMEQFSLFTATLAFGSGPISELMIRHGVIDILLTTMDRFPTERVQDAACLAIRNMLCQSQKSDPFLKRGNTSRSIVSAMEMHRNSVSIQTSACCIFWNMLSKTEEKEHALDPKTVHSIIKAMQSHMESGALLELACGALWVFLNSFDDQKMAVGIEAIDAVTCAMVMHPDTTTTLENACGFLSNLSSEESLAEAIATSQGVNIIAEAMCNNGNSIVLMEAGCLTLKNITSSFPSFARDASVVISTVITAMNDNVEYTSFMKEACDFLWVLALEEDDIRSKILALDGISILMKCLEKNSNNPEIQTSALGAFNQLAKSNIQNG